VGDSQGWGGEVDQQHGKTKDRTCSGKEKNGEVVWETRGHAEQEKGWELRLSLSGTASWEN